MSRTEIIHGGTPPAFSLPDFDAVTISFGAPRKAYLTEEQLGDWNGCYGSNSRTPYHECASMLFYKGGKLADYGLRWKASTDQKRAMAALRALLCSFEPSHEMKIGTCAVLLANYAEPIGANR